MKNHQEKFICAFYFADYYKSRIFVPKKEQILIRKWSISKRKLKVFISSNRMFLMMLVAIFLKRGKMKNSNGM